MTEQNLPTFAHILNQATSQDTWKTYFHTHNIDKDIPSGCNIFEGLVIPKACAKLIQYSCSLQPQTNTQLPIIGEFINTKYIDINKFFGKNKENFINWLDHSATKLQASRICKFTATSGFGLNCFPPPHQKRAKNYTKPLNLLGDLAHTVDDVKTAGLTRQQGSNQAGL
ncbi:hypothetical protein DSO57_1028467 [Entomophthora muscae]|uniref:Uncharacterized protein n=1 Tax=Entomophthora muscae TaxID=34485 RepID=A0ACC2SQI9_9FUNG|nr:hypothetical protein DSO57_1028467 [Entomophthora muscae]